MTYKKFLGKYDVLQLSEYKKIIAEDKHSSSRQTFLKYKETPSSLGGTYGICFDVRLDETVSS